MKIFLLLFAMLTATGCSSASGPAGTSDDTPKGAMPPSELRADAIVESRAAEVVTSCSRDSDCAVKNVGNCCGYFPACVHKDSATFPEQVKAQCEKEGTMGICGFREISSCMCVEGRCAAGDGAL